MPSFDEVLLSEIRAQREQGVDPFDGAFTGTSPRVGGVAERPNTFMENIYDNVAIQPFWRMTQEVFDSNYPPDESYRWQEDVKGYEQYSSFLREARNAEHMAAMKQRIDTYEERKNRVNEQSGVGADLLSEFMNPLNYIGGLGVIKKGVGGVQGFARGVGAVAPGVAVEEILRRRIDPTTTTSETVENSLTGLVFGGLLGSAVGARGGKATSDRLAKAYDDLQRALDGEPMPKAETALRDADIPTGVSSALGLEKVTSRMSSYSRLVSQGFRAVEDFANAMAGEFDLMFKRNEVGVPTEASAFLRAGQWRGQAADVIRQLDNIYNEYLGNGANAMTIGNVNVPVTMRRVGQALGMRPSDGLMTYQEFMESIFRAHKTDRIEADNPFTNKAAMVVREFFDKARDEGVKSGFLFNRRLQPALITRYQQRFDSFSKELADLDAKVEQGGTLSANELARRDILKEAKTRAEKRLKRAQENLGVVDSRAANDNIPGYEGPAGEKFYLSRIWDAEAIMADEAGPRKLRSILTSWYKENPGGLSVADAAVEKRVDDTIKTLLREGELGDYQIGTPKGGDMTHGRALDIPNELVADFVVRDVGHLIRTYANRAGLGIEFARKFGTRDAEDAIDDMLLKVAGEATGSYEQISRTLADIRNNAIELRDFTLGDAWAKNPAKLDRKAAQFLSSFAAVTQMGGSLISSLAEPAKQVLMHGVQRTLGFAMNVLSDPETFAKIGREMRTLTGEGIEVTLGMHMNRHIEQGGLATSGTSKLHRMVDKVTKPFTSFAQGPYYVLNLLGPFTDTLKTYSLVMSNHFMIEDLRAAAGGTATKKTVQKLASYGLSVDDAKAIMAEPIEKLTQLNLANTGAWADQELAAKFGMAVAGEVRRAVVTAGPANKPNITQGFVGKGDNLREFALLRLPFQYLNFGLAAINKTTLSALQGRDANAFAGMAAMVGMGYLVARLKASDSSWEKMEDGEKILRAVNFSGIGGLFADIPNMIENATRGQFGLRPALGLPPAYGYGMYDDYSALSSATGPGGSKVVDLYKLFVDDSVNERERARIIRRMVPLNDIFYWKTIGNMAERGLTDQLY